MRISAEESTAILIDIQERLFPHMAEKEKLLENCLKLTEGLRHLSINIMVTQQYTKGLGSTLGSIMSSFPGFSYYEKNCFSCADDPVISGKLKNAGKKNVILYGIETHVCVLQTCLDLINNGYAPVVVEDCVSSRKLQDKVIAIERMRQEGAIVTTMESILFEMTRIAGTDVFRKISAIIK